MIRLLRSIGLFFGLEISSWVRERLVCFRLQPSVINQFAPVGSVQRFVAALKCLPTTEGREQKRALSMQAPLSSLSSTSLLNCVDVGGPSFRSLFVDPFRHVYDVRARRGPHRVCNWCAAPPGVWYLFTRACASSQICWESIYGADNMTVCMTPLLYLGSFDARILVSLRPMNSIK